MRIKTIVAITLLAAAAFGLALYKFHRDSQGARRLNPVQLDLTVYTYPSFMSEYGPGPKLKAVFEKDCNCKVRFLNAGDSVVMVQKLKIKSSMPADVVIGLDQFTKAAATRDLEWETIDFANAVAWQPELRGIVKDVFVPYDWAPITFIYRKGDVAGPLSLKDLLLPKYKKQITMQDPRSSTPGLQFLYWLFAVYGPDEMFNYLSQLQPSIHSVSPSWSASYGLFKQKQAGLTLSYLTSPLYHWREEQNESYQPAVIAEGHPVQVEFMAVPKRCKQCELAKKFIRFLLTPESQQIIASHNYMLPVVELSQPDPWIARLPKVKVLPPNKWEEFLKLQDVLLQQWVKTSRDQ